LARQGTSTHLVRKEIDEVRFVISDAFASDSASEQFNSLYFIKRYIKTAGCFRIQRQAVLLPAGAENLESSNATLFKPVAKMVRCRCAKPTAAPPTRAA
jgi:hypothetical protein